MFCFLCDKSFIVVFVVALTEGLIYTDINYIDNNTKRKTKDKEKTFLYKCFHLIQAAY